MFKKLEEYFMEITRWLIRIILVLVSIIATWTFVEHDHATGHIYDEIHKLKKMNESIINRVNDLEGVSD